MRSVNYKLGLVLSFALILVSCVSAEELIRTEYEKFSGPNATILFEYAFESSSATGSCGGYSADRWYGTDASRNNITKLFEDQLSHNEWTEWSDDGMLIWRKETQNGLFTFALNTFDREEKIDPNQAYYILPETVLIEAGQYSYVYVISMHHMSLQSVERCFKR
jgi:hypothetical protein